MKDKLYQNDKLFKYQKGKIQWIENKILHRFLNEDLIKEKVFPVSSTSQNKTHQAVSKTEYTHHYLQSSNVTQV